MATETIIGSYRIEERIGRGGMGVVYRGQHTKLPREVAIKSINPRAGEHDLRSLRHRFEREAYIQSQLDHPGIVKIYDYIVAEQTYYIVMEYVEGRSLAQLLKQEGGPLKAERALALFDQILTAVVYAHTFTYQDQDGGAHRGIIHRDLKPPNILVTPEDKIKITDFGIVKVVGSETTDTFGAAYGSPRYVSPEQAEGLEVDQRSDIYSLGVILYEMLTGAPPFGNEREPRTRTEILRAHVEEPPSLPTEINPLIPLEVEDIILRALEKDPAGRYATAADFLRAIKTARERDAAEVVEAPAAEPKTYRPVGTHELH
jgi:serine/threonine-protein kinase